jgi:hypothetical protein
MRPFIGLCLLLVSTLAFAKNYYGYERKTEIPEPMFYDLVRSLHSQKGEIEVNALMFQSPDNQTNNLNISPEIEFVPFDHFGVEFELPTTGGNIHAYKAALQYGFDRGIPSLVNGVQLMYEQIIESKEKELTLKYLAGKRFKSLHSIFVMLGPRYELEHKHWQEIINLSYFYDFNDHIDLGLEINNISEKFEIQRQQILPQIHLAMGNHFKIQFGMGAQEIDDKWYSVSALRLIKEDNL